MMRGKGFDMETQIGWKGCLFLLLTAALCSPALLAGETLATFQPQVRVIGRSAVTVTTPGISLGDLAEIQGQDLQQDEIVIGLKKVRLGSAPSPGQETTIAAARILERLRTEGINLNQIGYRFPRVIKVRRAGRVLSYREVLEAVENYLLGSNRDIELKSIDYAENVYLAPGVTSLEVIPNENRHSNKLKFMIVANAPGQDPVHFDVRATVEEWREVPVATRALSRGSVINESDVRMARMNLRTLPPDAFLASAAVLGLEASRDLGHGEVFRQGKLAIPPVINVGSGVTLLYRSGRLEATATGVALEAGVLGQEIKVRNIASKRVIVGKVLEPGLVGVQR
jgi:flagella basal body P-ring formation protein FlgA